MKGEAKRPEAAKVLCGNSGAGVDWLVENLNLGLSLLALLGGQPAPRTYRGKEHFPGMTIAYRSSRLWVIPCRCSTIPLWKIRLASYQVIRSLGNSVQLQFDTVMANKTCELPRAQNSNLSTSDPRGSIKYPRHVSGGNAATPPRQGGVHRNRHPDSSNLKS